VGELQASSSVKKEVVMHAVARLVTGVVLLLAVSLAIGAEQPEKTYRVAYLAAAPRSSNQMLLAQFQQGMRELGYVEGRNLVLETRFAEGKLERLPTLAQELVQLKPDVMFVSTTPGALAAKAATPTIPIVFVAVADPVGSGLISNLARPDGNVTGVTHIVAELAGKRRPRSGLPRRLPEALGCSFSPCSPCEAPAIWNALSKRFPGPAPPRRCGWWTPPLIRSAPGRWSWRRGTACP
jgi:hypothetical protein